MWKKLKYNYVFLYRILYFQKIIKYSIHLAIQKTTEGLKKYDHQKNNFSNN